MNLIVYPQISGAAVQLSLLEPSHLLPVPIKQAPTAEPFELREYQKKVIKDLYQLYKQGKRQPFIYCPTGGGKTAIAAATGTQETSMRT